MFRLHSALPEKVHFAIELPVPGEALLGEVAAAFAALDALGVPGSVQHVEEEPVQDGPFAPGTVDHHVSDLQDAECRPSEPDCASRTGTTAEQRFGCGRRAVRRKLKVVPVQRCRSDSPVGNLVVLFLLILPLVTIHNPGERSGDFSCASWLASEEANLTCLPSNTLLKHHYQLLVFYLLLVFCFKSTHFLRVHLTLPLSASLCLCYRRFCLSATRVLRSDWTTPLLIPVAWEPIPAQLLWLPVQSCSLPSKPESHGVQQHQGRVYTVLLEARLRVYGSRIEKK